MRCAAVPLYSLVMPIARDDLREWLRQVLAHLGWTGMALAKAMDVSPSTINRFLNDPDATHSLSPKNLKAIERVTGFAPLHYPGMATPPGLAEAEAIPYAEAPPSGDVILDETIRLVCAQRQAFDAWYLKTEALTAAGFFPGDVVLVDLSTRPSSGDVVCAQVYDWTRGRAETVFRIYEPPYLISATSEARLMKPFLVDDDRVIIKGTVLQTLRSRRSQRAA